MEKQTTPDDKVNTQGFKSAEWKEAAHFSTVCTSCNKEIAAAYFDTGGKAFCIDCKIAREEVHDQGSKMGRFIKALSIVTLAVLISAIVYHAIFFITEYEFGLAAHIAGSFIIGIGLYEIWKINNRVEIQFKGPFTFCTSIVKNSPKDDQKLF